MMRETKTITPTARRKRGRPRLGTGKTERRQLALGAEITALLPRGGNMAHAVRAAMADFLVHLREVEDRIESPPEAPRPTSEPRQLLVRAPERLWRQAEGYVDAGLYESLSDFARTAIQTMVAIREQEAAATAEES